MSSPPPVPSPGLVPGPILPLSPPSPAVLLFPPPHPENMTPPAVERPPQVTSTNSTTLVALGVGIGIGGAIVLVCVGIFVVWYRRKRKRLSKDGFAFGHSQPEVPKDDRFNGPQYNQQPAPPLAVNVSVRSKISAPSVVSTMSSVSSGNRTEPFPQVAPDTCLNFTKTAFSYEELAFATDNFSGTNLLGQGGFGYVHKGVLRDGRVVAIKQLKTGSGQGEREFQAEVDTISRVNHKHLVSLFGHCISGIQKLLVYEYVLNQTLEFHLHGKGEPPMNWATRVIVRCKPHSSV